MAMSELEKQLLMALRRLSEQYEEDMKRLEAQNLRLQQQVQTLAEQVQGVGDMLQRLAED